MGNRVRDKLYRASIMIKTKLLDISISAKIILYYFVVLVISVIISGFLYQHFLSEIITAKVGNMSVQILQSISANFNSMIETTNEYSKIISSNGVVQDTLANSGRHYDYEGLHNVITTVQNLISMGSIVESAYIFDKDGNEYNAYNGDVKHLAIGNISQAKWYKEVGERHGGYILRVNAGNIFLPNRYEGKYISLIREIEDLRTQKRIGIMIVNTFDNALADTYQYIAENYDTGLVIMDDRNNIVVDTANKADFNVRKFATANSSKDSSYILWNSNHVEYVVTYLLDKEKGWKFISMIPDRELSRESSIFGFIAFAVLAGNALLLFLGSIVISRLITVPIKKLLKSMKGIENGEFTPVDIEAGNDEIGKLRDGYNKMISHIQKLISKILEEQKHKRKIELDVLQAQIKPHFLYNTFDAISSLALSGKNKDVYTIIKSLGTFYRTSLSRGSEIITIGEEIDVVVNYLIILKYRYEDMFTIEYDIDEEVKRHRILKLVLQPFVENAIYHGIREKGVAGKITVSAKVNNDWIILGIKDDGVGMSSEKINELLKGKISYNRTGAKIRGTELKTNTGFGISGTIERLRIFYCIEEIVSIESTEGVGTKVTIKIPLDEVN